VSVTLYWNRQVKGKVWFTEVSFCKISRMIAGICSLQSLTDSEPQTFEQMYVEGHEK
jgi:hypothetical protein